MFGFRYVKASPSHYLMQHRNGQIAREGIGLAFYYFAPHSSLVSIPLSAFDVPFMFEETTRDFQTVTLQGQVGYRIVEPKLLAASQDFSLLPDGKYATEDPLHLPERVLNAVKAEFRTQLQNLGLREVLGATATLATSAKEGLIAAVSLRSLGIEIQNVALLAVKPKPETAKALEAPMREDILRQADDATYARRNSALIQERAVRENELRSELAIEQKKREVRETQIETQRALLEKQQEIQTQELVGKVKLEEKNGQLVELLAEHQKREAETRAYGVRVLSEAMKGWDPRSLQALLLAQASPESVIALGFQNLADNAAKIGEFNFSPDLLRQITKRKE